MRIYYDVDTEFFETINEVTNVCPFKDVGFKGEAGGECKVGSVECQECKFCYGHHDSPRHSLVLIKNKAYLRTMPYVKCMWGLENTWREKIERFFYRFKQWINNLKANDPVYSCPVYKNEGCSHVDGLLCNFPKCDIIKNSIKK